MSARQVGWYIRLLAFCWQERGLSDNTWDLRTLAQVDREIDHMADDGDPESSSAVLAEFDAVLELFSLRENNRLFHPKIHQQILESEALSARRSLGASKTNAQRGANRAAQRGAHNTQRIAELSAQRSVRASDSVSGSVSKSSSEGESEGEADARMAPPLTPRFELYEKFNELTANWTEDKRGVNNGAQMWITLVDSGEINPSNVAEVLAGLKRWKDSDQWKKSNGKFVPNIANWLSRRSWKDHPKPASKEEW